MPHKISPTEDGQRLDRYLKTHLPTVPYIAIQKLLRTGRIRLNGKKAKPDARLAAGDELTLPPDLTAAPQSRAVSRSPYQLTNADKTMLKAAVVYEDDALLVLNKPAGLPAQAGDGQTRSLDRLLALKYGAEAAPKLAHRLDRDTTGIIMFGKTRAAAAGLTAQLRTHAVGKTYWALVTGELPATHGDIRAPIRKSGPHAMVHPDGDPAHTSWTLLHHLGDNLHLIAAVPHTGRMNQLRVHLASIGTPIVGDAKYGYEAAKSAARKLHPTGTPPLYLHAHSVTLAHPVTGKKMELTAPLPQHFADLSVHFPSFFDNIAAK